jgi:hypothetical protein
MNDYIVAMHISGVYDVNRNTVCADDDYSIIQDWANSISKLKLQGIIFIIIILKPRATGIRANIFFHKS